MMKDELLPYEVGDNAGKFDIDWKKVSVKCIPQPEKAIQMEEIPFMERGFLAFIRDALTCVIKTTLLEGKNTVEQFDVIHLTFVTTLEMQIRISEKCITGPGRTANPSRLGLSVISEKQLMVMVYLQWFNETKQFAEQVTEMKSNCTIEQLAAFIDEVKGTPITHLPQEEYDALNNL